MTFTRRCDCGNVLVEGTVPVTVIEKPCRCRTRGNGRPLLAPEVFISDKQRAERKRLGLPLLTDAEKHGMGARPTWR